jgi:hypothetical protein
VFKSDDPLWPTKCLISTWILSHPTISPGSDHVRSVIQLLLEIFWRFSINVILSNRFIYGDKSA